MELAGIAPSKAPPKIDGHSFAPVLLGKTISQPRFIYHEFAGPQDPVFADVPFPKNFGQNIRFGQWSGVAVCFKAPCSKENNATFFLYDMDKDQAQLNNVAADHPDVVAEIQSLMVSQYDKRFDPNGVFHPPPPPPRPPPPSPDPEPSPCDHKGKPTSGVYYGQKVGGHPYKMLVSADGKTATLSVMDNCCAWETATATIVKAGGAWEVRAKAVDKGGKPVVSPVGTVSADGCHIKWSERWAPWRKQAPEAAPTHAMGKFLAADD